MFGLYNVRKVKKFIIIKMITILKVLGDFHHWYWVISVNTFEVWNTDTHLHTYDHFIIHTAFVYRGGYRIKMARQVPQSWMQISFTYCKHTDNDALAHHTHIHTQGNV